MTSDLDLLEKFAQQNSQDAFSEIVRRHLDLVYSAALRQVRSPQLTEEIAQSVFADLALSAGKLSGPGVAPVGSLTPWLYAVTRRTAIDVLRKESRRQLREQIAVEMNHMNATSNDWIQMAPLLDDAMAALDETDRSAILLRYFENKSLREVGEALGTSDDAAQKRVSRAVERLREFFSKRKVTVGAGGLAILISANAVQSAPVGLAITISATALAGTTISASTAIATTKIIAMTTFQKTIIGATLAVVAGAGIIEAHRASVLRELNQTLQQQQAPLAEQVRQLQKEWDDSTNQLADLRTENEQLKSDQNETELLKLRGQIGMLNQELETAKRRLFVATGTTNDTLAASATTGILWRHVWKDAGNATPEAALDTYWWAVVNNRQDKLKQILVSYGNFGDTNFGPISDQYVRREVRSESASGKEAELGGVRFYREYGGQYPGQQPARARIGYESMGRVPDASNVMTPVDPANPPEWNPNNGARIYDLVRIDGEWKILEDKSQTKLTLDDEDSAAVANMLIQMPPDQVDSLKSKIPAETWRIYQGLKTQSAK